MIDPWLAVAIGAAVTVVFLLGRLVPRRPRFVRQTMSNGKLTAISLRLDALEQKQIANDHDVKNIRMAMGAVPTKDDMSKVLVEVSSLSGRVEGMHDTLATNGYSLRRIEDFLIKAAVDNVTAAKGSEAHK